MPKVLLIVSNNILHTCSGRNMLKVSIPKLFTITVVSQCKS